MGSLSPRLSVWPLLIALWGVAAANTRAQELVDDTVIDAPYNHGLLVTAQTLGFEWQDEPWFHVLALTPEGEPAAGADVWVDDTWIGTTDPHGAYAFQSPWGSVEVAVAYNTEDVTYVGSVSHRAARFNSWEFSDVWLETDAYTYAPGATVRLVAWSYAHHGAHRATTAPLTLTLEGHEAYADLLFDEDGWATWEWTIPTDARGIGRIGLGRPDTSDRFVELRVDTLGTELQVTHNAPTVITQLGETPRWQVAATPPGPLRTPDTVVVDIEDGGHVLAQAYAILDGGVGEVAFDDGLFDELFSGLTGEMGWERDLMIYHTFYAGAVPLGEVADPLRVLRYTGTLGLGIQYAPGERVEAWLRTWLPNTSLVVDHGGVRDQVHTDRNGEAWLSWGFDGEPQTVQLFDMTGQPLSSEELHRTQDQTRPESRARLFRSDGQACLYLAGPQRAHDVAHWIALDPRGEGTTGTSPWEVSADGQHACVHMADPMAPIAFVGVARDDALGLSVGPFVSDLGLVSAFSPAWDGRAELHAVPTEDELQLMIETPNWVNGRARVRVRRMYVERNTSPGPHLEYPQVDWSIDRNWGSGRELLNRGGRARVDAGGALDPRPELYGASWESSRTGLSNCGGPRPGWQTYFSPHHTAWPEGRARPDLTPGVMVPVWDTDVEVVDGVATRSYPPLPLGEYVVDVLLRTDREIPVAGQTVIQVE